jgi:hypothetical protein
MKWAEMTLDEKSAHIRGGVGRGLSARLIGFEVGTSRGAVIGHAHRYAVALRPANNGNVRRRLFDRQPALTSALSTTAERIFSGIPIAPIRSTLLTRLWEVRAWADGDLPEGPRYQPQTALPARRQPRRLRPTTLPSKPTNAPVSLLNRHLGFECSYIDGEPVATAACCGAPVEPGTSWCPWHLRIISAPVQQPRGDRHLAWFAR